MITVLDSDVLLCLKDETPFLQGGVGIMVRFFSTSKTPKSQLFSAARSGNVRKLNVLLDSGVDVNSRDNTGRTPLFVASKYGQVAVVQVLIGRGADPNILDQSRRSALFSAVHSGSAEVITCLIGAGASLDTIDSLGQNPAAYAKTKLKHHLVPLLEPKE